MNFRLLATVLCAVALFCPASAADARPRGDRARVGHAGYSRPEDGLARAVGRRCEGPSLAQHHRAPDRGPGRLGARRRAGAAKNPTRRGVTVWVETDGTVYWAVAENLVPTHGDGANRNDNKYIDNGPTYHQVIGSNSIGVEFAGNYPDVTRERHRGAGRGVADSGAGVAGALRHSARARLCAQLDRLQGRALLRRLRAGDAWRGSGGSSLVRHRLDRLRPSSGRCG